MTTKKVEALSQREYLLLKERLLKKISEATKEFIEEERLLNDRISDTDILNAEMEVMMDIAASAALRADETNRGDFLDLAVISFDSMVEILIEDTQASQQESPTFGEKIDKSLN